MFNTECSPYDWTILMMMHCGFAKKYLLKVAPLDEFEVYNNVLSEKIYYET